MEPPTVTSETIKEATTYEKSSKPKKKRMARTKRTLPKALLTIFETKVLQILFNKEFRIQL